jgi:hypothetical protein
MIWVDVIRGLVVLTLPLSVFFGPPTLWVMLPVAATVSGLNAFFSPSLRALIPELVVDDSLLQSTNGLMETTSRLARIVGPGMIGILNGFIPLIHFFTVDAFSFFISAFSINRIEKLKNENREGVFGRETISQAWGLLKTKSLLRYLVLGNGIVNPAWYLVFPLAVGLELHEKMPQNVGALGFLVAAYGIGNVASNIFIGGLKMNRPAFFCWLGRAACGLGFIGLAYSPSLPTMMVASALAAIGGPMDDLSFISLLQMDFRGRDIAGIFRLDMTITYGSLLFFYGISPFIFKLFGYQSVIAVCGLLMIAVSILGLMIFGQGPLYERKNS